MPFFFRLQQAQFRKKNPDNREDEEPIASVEDAGGELLETFPFDEVDDALEELFPEERLDFQETVSRMIKGDIDSVSGLFSPSDPGPADLCIPRGKGTNWPMCF